jgi:hypothetical protein
MDLTGQQTVEKLYLFPILLQNSTRTTLTPFISTLALLDKFLFADKPC